MSVVESSCSSLVRGSQHIPQLASSKQHLGRFAMILSEYL